MIEMSSIVLFEQEPTRAKGNDRPSCFKVMTIERSLPALEYDRVHEYFNKMATMVSRLGTKHGGAARVYVSPIMDN